MVYSRFPWVPQVLIFFSPYISIIWSYYFPHSTFQTDESTPWLFYHVLRHLDLACLWKFPKFPSHGGSEQPWQELGFLSHIFSLFGVAYAKERLNCICGLVLVYLYFYTSPRSQRTHVVGSTSGATSVQLQIAVNDLCSFSTIHLIQRSVARSERSCLRHYTHDSSPNTTCLCASQAPTAFYFGADAVTCFQYRFQDRKRVHIIRTCIHPTKWILPWLKWVWLTGGDWLSLGECRKEVVQALMRDGCVLLKRATPAEPF